MVVTLFVTKGRVTCIHTYTQHGNSYIYWSMKCTGMGSWPGRVGMLATGHPSGLAGLCGLVCRNIGVTPWVIFVQTSNTWYLRRKKRLQVGLRFPASWNDCAHCGMLARTPGYVVLEISTWSSGGAIWPNLGCMVLTNGEWETARTSISWMLGSRASTEYAREDANMHGSRDPDFGFLSEIDMC